MVSSRPNLLFHYNLVLSLKAKDTLCSEAVNWLQLSPSTHLWQSSRPTFGNGVKNSPTSIRMTSGCAEKYAMTFNLEDGTTEWFLSVIFYPLPRWHFPEFTAELPS
ncbi:hypothetical protein Patl1_24492 [Pistacia atlantica]|uniref:Uncharacterized protein n=1 Tax=Pistacia atlantica TaxID=434234 RepID=A0ACC0ZWD6_9ROSI|nr:hypothetical protein Patl1_24492 [Pistacia atlantica]